MMSTQFIKVIVLGLSLAGCASHDLEKKFFFERPAATRLDRLHQYPLDQQYRIFRYGSDKIHPPLITLAKPIAERGSDAVPFLLTKIRNPENEIEVRDVLQIFETMESINSYAVKSDAAVMSALRSQVSAMKDLDWRKVCEGMLGRIEAN